MGASQYTENVEFAFMIVTLAYHGAYIGILGLMECKMFVLYVIRKR